MKKFSLALLIALLVTMLLTGYSEKLNKELSAGIVRLHIVANSNAAVDQEVKLKIRDAVLCEMDKFESGEEIEENITLFTEVANRVLREENCGYTARAEFGRFNFPTKHYESFSLPKGEYNAVRILLGDAKGENWWCVLFPPLCMVDEATQDELLKETFGENYEVVTKNEKIPVKIKFKIAELF